MAVKKKRFQFFRDVKSGEKRVTSIPALDVPAGAASWWWPCCFSASSWRCWDNVIITPLLVFIPGIGA